MSQHILVLFHGSKILLSNKANDVMSKIVAAEWYDHKTNFRSNKINTKHDSRIEENYY